MECVALEVLGCLGSVSTDQSFISENFLNVVQSVGLARARAALQKNELASLSGRLRCLLDNEIEELSLKTSESLRFELTQIRHTSFVKVALETFR